MVNGNDLVEYEEKNLRRLVDEFIKERQDDWDQFVLEEFLEDG